MRTRQSLKKSVVRQSERGRLVVDRDAERGWRPRHVGAQDLVGSVAMRPRPWLRRVRKRQPRGVDDPITPHQ